MLAPVDGSAGRQRDIATGSLVFPRSHVPFELGPGPERDRRAAYWWPSAPCRARHSSCLSWGSGQRESRWAESAAKAGNPAPPDTPQCRCAVTTLHTFARRAGRMSYRPLCRFPWRASPAGLPHAHADRRVFSALTVFVGGPRPTIHGLPILLEARCRGRFRPALRRAATSDGQFVFLALGIEVPTLAAPFPRPLRPAAFSTLDLHPHSDDVTAVHARRTAGVRRVCCTRCRQREPNSDRYSC